MQSSIVTLNLEKKKKKRLNLKKATTKDWLNTMNTTESVVCRSLPYTFFFHRAGEFHVKLIGTYTNKRKKMHPYKTIKIIKPQSLIC